MCFVNRRLVSHVPRHFYKTGLLLSIQEICQSCGQKTKTANIDTLHHAGLVSLKFLQYLLFHINFSEGVDSVLVFFDFLLLDDLLAGVILLYIFPGMVLMLADSLIAFVLYELASFLELFSLKCARSSCSCHISQFVQPWAYKACHL